MIKKCLSLVFISLLVFAANAETVSAQTNTGNNPSTVEKIKANVLKRGVGEKKRVRVRMLDGTKMKGYISQAGEDSFTLADSKTKQTTTVAYRDVAQIKGQGLSNKAKIAIGVGIAAAVTVAVIGVAIGRGLDGLGGIGIGP